MQEQTHVSRQRLHPLLTAAAVSVTLFSAVGIGAVTGILPSSIGSAKPAPELVSEQASTPAPAPTPLAPQATPEEKKPEEKKAVKRAAPRPAAPSPYTGPVGPAQDFGELPRVAQAPAPAPVQKPQPAGVLGTVEAVREVKVPAKESNGIGPIAGGIAGAVLGDQIGKEFGGKGTRGIVTVLGAAGGAFGGRELEKQARATKHWEIDVRLDDGSRRTLTSEAAPYWRGGERVRLVGAELRPA